MPPGIVGDSPYDIRIYGCTNHAEDDVSTQGGAIDTTVILAFDEPLFANELNDTLDVVSGSSSDTTQTLTITGKNSSGTIISEVLNLNGTTKVSGTKVFQIILKVVCSGSHVGDITISRNSDGRAVGTLLGTNNAPGATAELTLRRPFYDASIPTSGTQKYYEKVFIKNNSSGTYYGVTVTESSDPIGSHAFDLESAQNDTNTVANRLTKPTTTLGTFDGSQKNVPGTNLNGGQAIGVWLELTLTAGLLANQSIYRLLINGRRNS